MSIYAYVNNFDARVLCIMINVRNVDLCIAFGKRLRKLRKAIPLSQELLANKADVSISQISRIERGLLNPTLSTVYALAEAIEIKPELLVCDLLD